jgi:hypothetical protein
VKSELERLAENYSAALKRSSIARERWGLANQAAREAEGAAENATEELRSADAKLKDYLREAAGLDPITP